MGVVVNPLRGRLGCKIYWKLLVPYWGDGRDASIYRLSAYIVGLFLWMFRFITQVSKKRVRFFITGVVVGYRFISRGVLYYILSCSIMRIIGG